MKKARRSDPKAVQPPDETPPGQGDLGSVPVESFDYRPAIRNLLGMLFRFILQQRVGALNDPSHALLEARYADFLDRVYGGDGGGLALQFVEQGQGGAL